MSPFVPANDKNPNQLFEYVLENYFRMKPVPQTGIELADILAQDEKTRQQIAATYHYPHIIETLAENDVSFAVRKAAQQNAYWTLLGQFKPLLTLSREDKIRFIQHESFSSILVFIVFDRDPEVLTAVFENPTISLQMLNTLRRYLQERAGDAADQQILKLLEKTIFTRKKRWNKLSAIARLNRQPDLPKVFQQLVNYLDDSDEVVIKSAICVLEKFDYDQLIKHLFKSAAQIQVPKPKFWRILTVLQSHYHPDIPLFSENGSLEMEGNKYRSIFRRQMIRRKILLLENCSSNLSDLDNFYTVVLGHLDLNKEIRRTASMIMTLDELLTLIEDPTFPILQAIKTLDLLKKHPFASVRKQLGEIAKLLAKRSNRYYKDLESTINASLDVVSNFGKSILTENDPQSSNSVKHIEYIYELVENVLNFPGRALQKEGYDYQSHQELYKTAYDRIYALWKVTIGQYLGRLKEISEIIQKRWFINVPIEFSETDLQQELIETLAVLERDYKKAVRCDLKTNCMQCKIRTCASERFLVEIEFMLGEILDILKQQPAIAPPIKAASIL